MNVNEDALVAVCLCTRLGRGAQVVPLDAREWTDLVFALQRDGQATPRALLDDPRTERVADLLRGLASVGLELERLHAHGVWVLTRGDEDYPRLWKRALRAEAPPVVFGAGSRAALSQRLVAIGKQARDAEPVVRAVVELCARDGWGVVTDRGALAFDGGGIAVEIMADSLEAALAKKSRREAVLDGRLTVLSPHSPNAAFTAARGAECARLVESLARYSISKTARPLRLPLGESIEAVFG